MKYGCNGCGYLSAQWLGFCPQCRESAGLIPVGEDPAVVGAVSVLDVEPERARHQPTGIAEFDRALGGGLVPGVAVLVAGEPGVGKSTLLLEVAAAAAAAGGRPVLFASGEESQAQIGARAQRVGAAEAALHVMSGSTVAGIISVAADLKPSLIVIDSVQTILPSSTDSAAGTMASVRMAAAELVVWAKANSVAVVLVGHVNKEGAIAGPKVLEHAVDVVAYLEGDHHRDLRVLRCRKNRYGPTSRIGLFRLSESGMEEVADASAAMVGSWQGDVPGSVAFPAYEGGRPIVVEIQALVTPSAAAQRRRSVRGIDSARLHQVVAVLERHAGMDFRGLDIYVGVSGGIKVREPAADLPVALALSSSLADIALGRLGAWGEVGLTGEVRSVAHSDRRREEAERIGLSGFLTAGDGLRRISAVVGAAGLS